MKLGAVVAVVLAALLSGSAALAGYTDLRTVVTWSDGAYGVVGSARYSANSVEYIGCYTYAQTSGSAVTQSGTCAARSAGSVSKACWTTDSKMLDVMESINDMSFIWFNVAADGTCSFVRVSNYSSSMY